MDAHSESGRDEGGVPLEDIRMLSPVAADRNTSFPSAGNRLEEVSQETVGHADYESSVHPAIARSEERADPRGAESRLARKALLQVAQGRSVPFARAHKERLELIAIVRIDLVLEESLDLREKRTSTALHAGEAIFAPEGRQHAPVLDSPPVSTGHASSSAELPRKLSVLDSAAIVVGSVIGSAIFIVPNSVAQNLPSIPLFLGVWVFTGVLSFFGALAYAELGAMMPRTGG
jgi:hypothetical protein